VISEIVSVMIDGSVQGALVPDIIDVEVEEDVVSAGVFRLRLAITPRRDGSWKHLDDDRFALWRRAKIDAGYPGSAETIIDGYITHVEARLSKEDPYLEISGLDVSAAMDLEEKQRAWVNKKDHEIAQDIFSSYGLSYEVEDTVAEHSEDVATILQNETDIRFLRRLAARNGFECHVHAGTGFFRSPNMQDPPQKLLAVEFGGETNVSDFLVRMDGTPGTLMEIRRIDPLEKLEETETLPASPRRSLGARSLADLRNGQPAGRVLVRNQPSTIAREMQTRLRQAYEGASGFVTVEGEIDSRVYRAVLRARRLVTIKGAGESYSGLYYVTRVRHTFTVDGYTQRFTGYRNAIGLTGQESFAAATLPIAIQPGIAQSSRAAGNRVLPAQQAGSTLPGGF
jgi:phage protein D